MAYLAETELNRRGEGDQLEHGAEALLASLRGNGQVWGAPLIAMGEDQSLRVVCEIPCADSLDARYHSASVQKDLDILEGVLGQTIVWRIRGTPELARQTVDSMQACPSFLVRTHAFEGSSPVQAFDTGEAAPLYLLPLEAELRVELFRWMRAYAAHDFLWLDSHALEFAAYHQLSNVDSELSRRGRALRGRVEVALGKPTYYSLMRYFVPPSPADQERCPLCGSAWRISGNGPAATLLRDFVFRCEPCRLVSTAGVVTTTTPARDPDEAG